MSSRMLSMLVICLTTGALRSVSKKHSTLREYVEHFASTGGLTPRLRLSTRDRRTARHQLGDSGSQ